jgi:diguanylate cyclase (GGDEF)-like protein
MPLSHLSAAIHASDGSLFGLSLRGRMAALMIALSAALAAIMYGAQEWVVMPTFVELERTAAQRNVNRCVEALQRDLHSLGNMVSDWACWDDSYRYIEDRNQQYAEANLVDETFANADLNLICYMDNNREIVWGEARTADGSAPIDLPETFAALRDRQCLLSAPRDEAAPRTGIMSTSHGPILLAAHPILNTKHIGPSRGTIIMGRLFDADEVQSLAERVQVRLRSWTIGRDRLPQPAEEMLEQRRTTLVTDGARNELDAYQIVADVSGAPALVLRVEMPRDVTAQGQVAARFATACMIVGSGVTMVVVWLVLQGGVVTPLRQMAAHVIELGNRGSLQTPLAFRRRDEIGTLANAFDCMVERICHVAYHDAVTDLPNRACLIERLRECFQRSQANPNYRFGLLFIDVDNFKLVNDSLGHRAGDQLLKQIAGNMHEVLKSIQSSVRHKYDTVARLGGDEFVVLLDDIGDAETLLCVAQRVREYASATIEIGSRRITPGLSVGAAISSPDYLDPADVLRDADTALYHAKSQGKRRTSLFDQAMRSRVLERADLVNDLQRALANREFSVYFQPIVNLESNRVACLEALVRWRHPVRGLVPPDDFLDAAEEHGVIELIGEQVLEEVCRQMAAWRADGAVLAGVPVSVNVTAHQLVGTRLLEQIDECMSLYGIEAADLKIELTETTAIRAVDASRCVFEALAERGIEIYLDDFGTGYSSLSALHSLPFSAIKLDRGFVREVESNPENEATVRAMVMIAEARNLRLVAEGIETAEQLATLRQLDCRYGQGFYFSRPRPANELETLLAGDLTLLTRCEAVEA